MEAWAAVLSGFAFIFIVARINKRARVKSPLIQRVERLIDAGYQLDRVIKAGRVRRMVEVEAEAEIEAREETGAPPQGDSVQVIYIIPKFSNAS